MAFQSMTIGKRIGVGFSIVLFLLVIIGIATYVGVGSIVENASEVISGNQLDANLAQKEVDHLNWAAKVNQFITDTNIKTLEVQTDHRKCAFGKWLYGSGRSDAEHLIPALRPIFKDIESPHEALHDSAVEIKGLMVKVDPELGQFLAERIIDHLNWTHKVKDAFLSRKATLNLQTDPRLCHLGKWMYSAETSALKETYPGLSGYLSQLESPHDQLHQSAIEIEELLKKKQWDKARAYFNSVSQPQANATVKVLEKIIGWHKAEMKKMTAATDVYNTKTLTSLETVQHLISDLRQTAKKNIMTDTVMLDAAQTTRMVTAVMSIIAIIMGLGLAFGISRGIIKVLGIVSTQMAEGASQVSSASGQVSDASQSLAEGASEQAASIEETSSAMEEMAAMTKGSADNANMANNLMKETQSVAEKSNLAMGRLTSSMTEMSKASAETSKIIKTIDEIAFQTNLLALNAAVEAARAGDAGAGFAVVADEVRNLAMRAADAVKHTSGLIEDVVKRIEQGNDIVSETNDAFTELSKGTDQVSQLIDEIAVASNEQSNGIEQVNRAIVEMDKVTQSNAANAEESASASEELNAQAEQMKDSAMSLVELVGGRAAKKVFGDGSQVTAPPARVLSSRHQAITQRSPQALPDNFDEF